MRSMLNAGMVASAVAVCLLGHVNAARAEASAQAALKANIVRFAQSKLGTKIVDSESDRVAAAPRLPRFSRIFVRFVRSLR